MQPRFARGPKAQSRGREAVLASGAPELASRLSASLRSVTTVGRSMSSSCWLPTSLHACRAACQAAPDELRPSCGGEGWGWGWSLGSGFRVRGQGKG